MGLTAKPPSSNASATRPKRSQVSRACDWCRVHRVKCDTEQPCQNCRNRGAPCNTTGANEIRNLPHAFREIERLRCRVKELEQDAENRQDSSSTKRRRDSPHSGGSPFSSHTRASTPFQAYPAEYDPELWTEHRPDQKTRALGVFAGDGRVKQWFGPTSLVYFISRMTSHLAQFGGHHPLDHTIHWSSTTPSFSTAGLMDSSPEIPPQDLQGVDALDSRACSGPCHLSPLQEEYFLAMFWQSYHCYLQIVDETCFREMYRSLWTNGAKKRKPSALVDIILALCVQYDTALPMRRGRPGPVSDPSTKDTTMAGRYLYQRCQTLLVAELENPTMSTLQCQIFSFYYLCCASFQNMAHSMLATAMRTAQLLGLHLEPPEDLPRPERELRKRIWWTLYSLESKTCIKLGRPWSASMSDITCSLPADDHALAIQSGSAVLAGDNVTWLTYTLQSTKLMLAIRNIYVSFHRDLARLTANSDASSIYADPCLLETLSASLLTHVSHTLTPWTAAVPDAMRCQRVDSSAEAFTATPSKYHVLSIEAFAPLWLQRQRLFLELIYHNFAMTLYRPLLDFTSSLSGSSSASPSSSLPGHTPPPKTSTELCADACVDHAITLTSIAHQALSETDVLKGCHEIFQWQWNAAITLLGYQLACPGSDRASAAREAVDVALQVFEIFGQHFEVGKNAGRVVRNLLVRIDSLVGGGFAGDAFLNLGDGFNLVDDGSHHAHNGSWDGGDNHHMAIDPSLGPPPVSLAPHDGSVYPGLQDVLSGAMDVAFSVDSFSNFDASFHNGGGSGFVFADPWVFPRST
ncbi:transcriptional activator protein acu-15 [Podospora conica]|nr:transcriptional activator protein acu-15 [Schizothecium conicum]